MKSIVQLSIVEKLLCGIVAGIACGLVWTDALADVTQNKAVVLRSVNELWSKGNEDIADAVYADDFVCHNLAGPDWHGRSGIKEAVKRHRLAFPDWLEHVEDLVAENDRVVIRLLAAGTQRGEFAGVSPTGRKMSVREISIYRIVNGKIAEQWGFPDIYGMQTQLHKP